MAIHENNIQSVSLFNVQPMFSKDMTMYFVDLHFADGNEEELSIGVTSEKENELGGPDKVKSLFADTSYVKELIRKAKANMDGMEIRGWQITL